MATTTTTAMAANSPPQSIVFFHPDLGIGGAERLVVDAAVALQLRGHKVTIFTNHCSPTHCFDECRDGTLDVRVRGNSLVPPSILSRLTILCTILRHVHLLLAITLNGELAALQPDVFIVDQLSAGLPLMRLLYSRVGILFYCHFPDLLLARGREALIKSLYRAPFDWVEGWSMGFAHAVAVNSNFTRGIVGRTWPGLKEKVPIKVIYPCVDTEVANTKIDGEEDIRAGKKLILSINRFERKKDIDLAIKAFAKIPTKQRQGVRLVLAGGYDARVSENVLYHNDLQALATSLSLTHHTITPSKLSAIASLSSVPATTQVLFLLSVPNTLKSALLRASHLLLYTPTNEHFGIVPLEAMLAHLPVLAANTGGPVETIADNKTGWLRDPQDTQAWSDVISHALKLSPDEMSIMGVQGEKRVRQLFGRDKMGETLDESIKEIIKGDLGSSFSLLVVGLFMVLSAMTAAVVGWGVGLLRR